MFEPVIRSDELKKGVQTWGPELQDRDLPVMITSQVPQTLQDTMFHPWESTGVMLTHMVGGVEKLHVSQGFLGFFNTYAFVIDVFVIDILIDVA